MKRSRRRLAAALRVAAMLAALLLALGIALYRAVELPAVTAAAGEVIRDRHGGLLAVTRSAQDTFRLPVALEGISPWLQSATIAVEDERFFEHPGVDLLAVARALRDNALAGRRVSGASTLTMQLVRMAHPRPRTLRSKVIEAITALKLERARDKERILEDYLNLAPYGGNLVGCEAASWRWFAKAASDLDLAEAALLAGLPQSPERLRPDRHPAAALRRRAHVLARMVAEGAIDAEQARRARAAPLGARAHPWPARAPHAVLLARRRALRHPGRSDLRTTLDPELQQRVEAVLGEHIARARPRGVSNGALVVIENETCAIRALVGSVDPGDDAHGGQVDGANSPRSPGSTLKPFLYALAFERGDVGYEERLANLPRRIGEYMPENFDRTSGAPVPAWEALARSLNIPAVAVLERVGIERFLAHLGKLGFKSLNGQRERFGLSLALGACEVTLLECAQAYACLGRGGTWLPARILASEPVPAPVRVFRPGAVALVHRALSDPRFSALGPSTSRTGAFFAKTGTSYGLRDAWTLATSSRWTVGVWVGNVDGSPAQFLVGLSAAAPIARDIISILPGPEGETTPAELESLRVCCLSGLRAGGACPSSIASWSVPGAARRPCPLHGDRGPAECPPPRILAPLPGAPYRALDTGADDRVAIPLRAHAPAARLLHWFLDGRLVVSCKPAALATLRAAPGLHLLRCVDAHGRAATVRFRVAPR